MGKHRVQLDFFDEAFDVLQKLGRQTNASSHAEVIRNSLGLLKWVIEEKQAGNRILVESKEGEVKEIVLPFIISASI